LHNIIIITGQLVLAIGQTEIGD